LDLIAPYPVLGASGAVTAVVMLCALHYPTKIILLFQGVGEDGQAVEGSLVVDGPSQLYHRAVIPRAFTAGRHDRSCSLYRRGEGQCRAGLACCKKVEQPPF
jgi:hypothetical protein